MINRAFGNLRKMALLSHKNILMSNRITLYNQKIFVANRIYQKNFRQNFSFDSQNQNPPPSSAAAAAASASPKQTNNDKNESSGGGPSPNSTQNLSGRSNYTAWAFWIAAGCLAVTATAGMIEMFKNAPTHKPLHPRALMGGLDWDEENSTLVHSDDYKFFVAFLPPAAREEYMRRVGSTKLSTQVKIDRLLELRGQAWSEAEKDKISAQIVETIEQAEIDWNGVWRGSNYMEVLEEVHATLAKELGVSNHEQ